MTREEIMNLDAEGIESRKAELKTEIENATEQSQLDAIAEERSILDERVEALNKEIESRKANMLKVANGAGNVVAKAPVEVRTNDTVRASKEYTDAYARYLISGDANECRSLLTSNVSGSLPVPTVVDEIIRTAWDKSDILSRVKRTYFKGNLKVAFEKSATGANVHTEGSSAPTEEELTLGIVEMVPANIKKWITVSDEALTMGGEAFLDYVYRELAHQITKKLADLVVADISGAQTSADGTHTAQAKITAAPSVTVIGQAFANLSDEAENPVVIMNKLTYANFLNAQAAASFAMDPFRGMPVLFNNTLPAYDSASAAAVYAIVGDLNGAQVNYPEGDGVALKFDDLSLAEKDMVKIVGRQYAAHGVTASGRFCRIAKPSGT